MMGNFTIILLKIWVIYFIFEIFLSKAFYITQDLIDSNVIDSIFYIFNLHIFRMVGIISGLSILLNFKTKLSLGLFIFSFLYLKYFIFLAVGSYGYWVFYTIPLLLIFSYLIFSERNIDKNIVIYLKICYALFYFFAGYSKIFPFWRFPDWLSGYTIENLLLSRQYNSILYNFFNFDVFLLNPITIKIGIFLSVILELSAILLLFYPKFSLLFIPLILLFHFMLFLSGTPGIVVYSFAALIFLPQSLIDKIAKINFRTK